MARNAKIAKRTHLVSLPIKEVGRLELLRLSEKGEENRTRLEHHRRNEITANIRRAHPEINPLVIARERKTDKKSD